MGAGVGELSTARKNAMLGVQGWARIYSALCLRVNITGYHESCMEIICGIAPPFFRF